MKIESTVIHYIYDLSSPIMVNSNICYVYNTVHVFKNMKNISVSTADISVVFFTFYNANITEFKMYV